MSLQPIAWRRVRTLNRRLGTRFVHAAVNSDGRVWVCVAHDGTVEHVDVRTGERSPASTATTTGALLKSREPRDVDQVAWLIELDLRALRPEPGMRLDWAIASGRSSGFMAEYERQRRADPTLLSWGELVALAERVRPGSASKRDGVVIYIAPAVFAPRSDLPPGRARVH